MRPPTGTRLEVLKWQEYANFAERGANLAPQYPTLKPAPRGALKLIYTLQQ